MTSSNQHISKWTTKDALRTGWDKTRENIWFLLALMLISYVLSYLLMDSVVGVLVSLFTGYIGWSVFLRLSRGVKVDFQNIFDDLSGEKFFQYFLAMLVLTVFVLIGFILIIIPGIIIAIMTSLTAFIIMDEKKDIAWNGKAFWHAIKRSRELTDGEKWNLFGFFLVILAINVLGALAFGFGLLVTVPITGIAFAHIYNALKNKENVVVPEVISNTETPHSSQNTETNN